MWSEGPLSLAQQVLFQQQQQDLAVQETQAPQHCLLGWPAGMTWRAL